MDEQAQELFSTVVLSFLRANGGTLFIPSNILASGNYTVSWERTPKGLRITETTAAETEKTKPKRKPRKKVKR